MKKIFKSVLLLFLPFVMTIPILGSCSNGKANSDNVINNNQTNNEDNKNIDKLEDKPNNGEDEQSEEEHKPKEPLEPIIERREPVIKSENYHAGFEDKIYSSLFPYEPTVRETLPEMNITTNDNSNDFATINFCGMDDVYMARKNNQIKYIDCKVNLEKGDDKFNFENVDAQIKLRGNASCYSDKKAFSLKFKSKTNLLGLNNNNKFKKYVLDPLYYDPSFLKEATALYLGKQMFNYDNLYTSDTTPIVLYLNNTYWGVYLLKEAIQVNKNRVNIDDIEKREPIGAYTGIDTGYLFEYDGYGLLEESYGLNPIFKIDYNNNAPLKTIEGKTTNQASNTYFHSYQMVNEFTLKSDIYSQDQLDFLASYVGKVYKIVYEAAYNDIYYVFNSDYSDIEQVTESSSKEIIDKVIDINSFVDMYLLQEMCCNNDMYWGSQYFQLDMSSTGNKKLTFSSAWDYDWGFGRGSVLYATLTNGDDVNTLYAAKQFNKQYTNAWYLLLIHEDWFIDLVKEKWQLLVKHGVLYNALHFIDEFSFVHTNYYKENFAKWPFIIFGNEVAEYANNRDNLPLQTKYLFKWLAGKFNFLNTIFGDNTVLFNI